MQGAGGQSGGECGLTMGNFRFEPLRQGGEGGGGGDGMAGGRRPHRVQHVGWGGDESRRDGRDQHIFNVQGRDGRHGGHQRVRGSGRKEHGVVRGGGCRVGGVAGEKAGGVTVSHGRHHLNCGVLRRKLRGVGVGWGGGQLQSGDTSQSREQEPTSENSGCWRSTRKRPGLMVRVQPRPGRGDKRTWEDECACGGRELETCRGARCCCTLG